MRSIGGKVESDKGKYLDNEMSFYCRSRISIYWTGDVIKVMIGATSWQINGSFLENIEHRGENIQFCELLVYTWNSNTERTFIREIDDIRRQTKISVHLPTDKLEHVKNAYAFFKDREYLNITIHPFMNFKEFADFYFSITEGGKKISIENLENDLFFEFCDYLKEETSNIKVTMDYGHLLFEKRSVEFFYERFSGQITEIHFHGSNEKKAHVFPDQKTIKDFEKFAKNKKLSDDFPVCIELFNLEEAKKVAATLKGK